MTRKPRTCPCTLFPSTATPGTPSSNDTNAVEVGVKFKADQDGYVNAVKFYKATYPPAKFPRHTLRNQAGVRAMHIVNSASGEWEGANLYETPRGEVRVFVMGRVEKPQEPAPPLPAPTKKAEQRRPRKSGNP